MIPDPVELAIDLLLALFRGDAEAAAAKIAERAAIGAARAAADAQADAKFGPKRCTVCGRPTGEP